jgi:hypothetical protein
MSKLTYLLTVGAPQEFRFLSKLSWNDRSNASFLRPNVFMAERRRPSALYFVTAALGLHYLAMQLDTRASHALQAKSCGNGPHTRMLLQARAAFLTFIFRQ